MLPKRIVDSFTAIIKVHIEHTTQLSIQYYKKMGN